MSRGGLTVAGLWVFELQEAVAIPTGFLVVHTTLQSESTHPPGTQKAVGFLCVGGSLLCSDS